MIKQLAQLQVLLEKNKEIRKPSKKEALKEF